MTTPLACVGLAVDGLPALEVVLDAMTPTALGRAGEVDVVRFDDAGGAGLVIGTSGRTVVDLVPLVAAEPGAPLARVTRVGDVATADVVDARGETLTRLAGEMVQLRALGGDPVPEPVDASVVALGLGMSAHADADAFAASDASLLGDAADSGGPDALRYAPESFVSYGLFGGEPDPGAFLAGTVLDAATHLTEATGQLFHAVRVRTAGFEATVCLPADLHPTPPPAGSVVAGRCHLVLDAPGLWPAPSRSRRRRWGRR